MSRRKRRKSEMRKRRDTPDFEPEETTPYYMFKVYIGGDYDIHGEPVPISRSWINRRTKRYIRDGHRKRVARSMAMEDGFQRAVRRTLISLKPGGKLHPSHANIPEIYDEYGDSIIELESRKLSHLTDGMVRHHREPFRLKKKKTGKKRWKRRT